MPRALSPLLVFAIRYGVLLMIYSLLRLMFLILHPGHFPDAPIMAFIGGLRFDLWSITWLMVPYAILFFIWPQARGWKLRLQHWVFMVPQTIGIMLNTIDLAYFDFTLKRSTADLLGIAASGGDLLRLLPGFIVDHWFLVFLFMGIIWLLWIIYEHASTKDTVVTNDPRGHVLWVSIALLFMFIASRGGVQLKPVNVLHAGNYAPPAYIPLVLNTPFTFLSSLGKPVISDVQYMTPEEAAHAWPVIHRSNGAYQVSNAPNVVILILESFAAEYSGRLNGGTGYMPFLDSLMGQGLLCKHAYANGHRSVDALPAIIASIPELAGEAFISSPYANAPITSIANILKPKGYASSFYHGGHNGTMGFDVFLRAAGFDRYVGFNEYPNNGDDDGSWGIYDGPFLKFYAEDLSREQAPFLSVFFSLSSHHPYQLPPGMEDRYPDGPHKIHKTIRYTDDALRGFFNNARRSPWFANTLFVITADHTAQLTTPAYNNDVGSFAIPLLYYMPGFIPAGATQRVTQQIDILPTVMDLIGHTEDYFSFGQSLWSFQEHGALMRHGETTQIIGKDRMLKFDGEKVVAYMDFHDPAKQRRLPMDMMGDRLEVQVKAALQQFGKHMNDRTLVVR